MVEPLYRAYDLVKRQVGPIDLSMLSTLSLLVFSSLWVHIQARISATSNVCLVLGVEVAICTKKLLM